MSIPRTTNPKARKFVQERKPFRGANTFGEQIGEVYAVYSYGYHFPLFAYKDNVWYVNTDKYSVTTSKHYSQLHPHTETVPVTTEQLKEIINR